MNLSFCRNHLNFFIFGSYAEAMKGPHTPVPPQEIFSSRKWKFIYPNQYVFCKSSLN